MAKKLWDLSVKTGSYTDREGNTKHKYENIGAVFDGERGPYMVLKRHFNPAGIAPAREGSDSIGVYMFEQREENQRQFPQNRQPQRQEQSGGGVDMEDIPFAAMNSRIPL